MSKLQIAVFNVGAGQSILLYPVDQKDHAQLIDCGGDGDFSPVDFIVDNNLLPNNKLGGLILTNYDHDHFSWLPDLRSRVDIWTTRLPKNITSQELKYHKYEVTDALNHVCHLKDTYISPVVGFKPIYQTYTYHLRQADLDGDLNTNHLSQMVFIEYGGSKICISGDLERPAWEKILNNQEVISHLKGTHILVAPHHGRDNGYHEDIFQSCAPEVVVISDKEIMYGTQEEMAQTYANHVSGTGVPFGPLATKRKVLTTRNDGHLLIELDVNGGRSYTTLNI
ncbi:conserved hypothetical protein [Candidatus Nitrotoga sp. HW29]|uniref:MBL fold metallo-hydrolase n=1 Tax=Candidatus Nitrotoga sp. HW29 TaxID=2886963 RepID=UPI001EF246DD|nr:MBL fold metallo-hydrolase [Candidatus Nitrotoga sp. HW29]CAH1903565.1 conserved hypothetical protein [Candidatus Nitrotoga sp. HW29]